MTATDRPHTRHIIDMLTPDLDVFIAPREGSEPGSVGWELWIADQARRIEVTLMVDDRGLRNLRDRIEAQTRAGFQGSDYRDRPWFPSMLED